MDVLVAAYQDIDAARRDFDGVVRARQGQEGQGRGRHPRRARRGRQRHGRRDRRPRRAQGRRLGRRRRRARRACSRRRCSRPSPSGAAAGAIVGKFAKHKLESGIQDKIGEAMPPGSGGHHRGLPRRPAAGHRAGDARCRREVARALGREGPAQGAQGLTRRGDGQVQPGPHGPPDPRPQLRRHDRPHAGHVRRGLEHQPDCRRRPRARRTSCSCSSTTPASATRARSAARSRPRTTRGWPSGGLRYNRFHVTALCSPTRAALLTGRNNHAVGFGSVGEFAGAVPGLLRDAAPRLRAVAADPAGQRLQHRRRSASGT